MKNEQRYILIDVPFKNGEKTRTYDLEELYQQVLEEIEIEKESSKDPEDMRNREYRKSSLGLIEPKMEFEDLIRWLNYYAYEVIPVEQELTCEQIDSETISIKRSGIDLKFSMGDFKKIVRFGNKIENLELIRKEFANYDADEFNERLKQFDLTLDDVLNSEELMDELESFYHEDRKIDIRDDQAFQNLIFLLENWPQEKIWTSKIRLDNCPGIKEVLVTAPDLDSLVQREMETVLHIRQTLNEPKDVLLSVRRTRYGAPLKSCVLFGKPIDLDHALKEILAPKKQWEQTDDDTSQYCLKLSEYEYELVQLGEWEDGSCIVCHTIIDVRDTLKEEETLRLILTSYDYKSINDLKKTYGDSYLQILAECIFETECFDFIDSRVESREKAEAIIKEIIER